jgi:hypothetical protein
MTRPSFRLPESIFQITTIRLTSYYILIFTFASITASQISTFTIESANAYPLMRTCAQYCLTWGIPSTLDCPGPILNACACRTDLIPQGTSFITQCVNSGCTSNTDDVFSAVSLYINYCSVNGYVENTATTTSTESPSQPTIPSFPLQTSSRSSSTSSTMTPTFSELLLMLTFAPTILLALVQRLH